MLSYRLSTAKLSNGVFTGPQIDRLCNSSEFEESLTLTQWITFSAIVNCFKHVLAQPIESSDNAVEIVKKTIQGLETTGANYSSKMHYLHCHIDTLRAMQFKVTDQHGEKFHQTLRQFEERYEGKKYINMLSDYMWHVA